MKRIYLIFLLFSIFACHAPKPKSKTNFAYRSDIRFKLDSLTAYKTSSLQFWTDKSSGIDYLTFVNTATNSLYFYRYANQKKDKILYFAREGENAIPSVHAHHILNQDTIIIINRARQIYLADFKGNVLYQKKTFDLDHGARVLYGIDILATSTQRPITVKGENAYFNGVYVGSAKIKPVIKFNLKKHNIQTVFKYPSIPVYSGEDRIIYSLYFYSSCFNDKLKQWVYCFPPDNNLYITSDHKKIKTYRILSDWDDEVKPYIPKSITADKYMSLLQQTAMYNAIIYDTYNNCYYRIIKLPYKDKTDTEIKNKKIAIQLIDSTFKEKATLVCTDNYESSMYFVSPKGLNICNLTKTMQNENYLVFDIFK